jgi:hypothetical protein
VTTAAGTALHPTGSGACDAIVGRSCRDVHEPLSEGPAVTVRQWNG